MVCGVGSPADLFCVGEDLSAKVHSGSRTVCERVLR